jgi:predicted AlkP superfamily phosphohydrolase/phosphomutase
MLWRFRDPEHPYFEPDVTPELAVAVENQYRRCDALLTSVLAKVDEGTLLVVLSDHGFGTFRRAFDTNTWLWQNGLLVLKDGKRPNPELVEGFSAIEWSKSHAYAVGLGGIYLNLKGREAAGIVEEGTEAERIRRAIRSGLPQFVDAQSCAPAIRSVSRREEIYAGPFALNSPDLLVNFHRGFRVSWQSAVGGFADSLIADNMRRWSGDHIVDPESIPGVLFMNRRFAPGRKADSKPQIIDLAPTILNYMAVPAPPEMEGATLL